MEQDVYHLYAMVHGHRPTPAPQLKLSQELEPATNDGVERDDKTRDDTHYDASIDTYPQDVFTDLHRSIVITPAEETWADDFVPFQHHLEPQWPCYLMVTQCDASPTCQYPPMSHPDPDEPLSNLSLMRIDNLSASLGSYRPKLVFNRSRFIQSIERSSTERLIMYHVFTALQRHQCRAAAFAAAGVASSFRKRYESPDFVFAAEKPFRWTDPAEPLLLSNRYNPGTIVIVSDCPYFAPHIIINFSPPQNPWVAWANATNDPQNCGYGQFLVVPARLVTFVNEHREDFENEVRSRSEIFEHNADPLENLSRPETPTPETPIDDEPHSPVGLYDCYDDKKPLLDYSEPLVIEITFPTSNEGTLIKDLPPSLLEDEDDDLPPFDEWYQAISARSAQLAI